MARRWLRVIFSGTPNHAQDLAKALGLLFADQDGVGLELDIEGTGARVGNDLEEILAQTARLH